MVDFIHDHKRSDEIIFIGICPSSKTEPFSNGSFNTLKRWCNSAGIYEWDFHNVIPDKINSLDIADVDCHLLLEKTSNKQVVVALGGFVSRVLKKYSIHHIMIDHPSPRNRNLNDSQRHQDIIQKLKDIL